MPHRMIWIAPFLVLSFLSLACHEIDFSSRFAEGEIDIFDDLFSIAVGSEKVAVAVGYYGAIYQTEDGGESWIKRDSGTRASLYDVSMADERRGWIVGQLGLILRTVDGGRTWERQANLKETQGTHLFTVHAVDANTAWAVGEWGTRLYTDDGGSTWQDLSLTIHEQHPQFVWLPPVDQERVREGKKVYEDVGLNDVFCLDPPSKRCWLIGEFGYIFHSENLGRTWERGKIVGDIKSEPIRMAYDETELGATDEEGLKRFAMLIADQQHLNIEIEPRASEREVRTFGKPDDPYPLFEVLDARALSVRSVLEEAGILSDRIRMRGQPPWDYEDFIEDDPEFLTRYLEERISPEPGVAVRVAQNPYLFSIHFKNEKDGLIAGLGGVVLRSSDGGLTWTYAKTDRKQALFAVRDDDPRSLLVGEKGLVRISTDGGSTWEPPADGFPTLFTFMRNLDFVPSGDKGFIVGQRGMILRTLDRGRTWNQVLPPESRRYADAS